MSADLSRRAAAECLGTAFLLAVVIGSGIMGERLAGGNVAIALLANTLATGAALVALILTFGPVSGAHFNPAVTLAEATPVHEAAALQQDLERADIQPFAWVVNQSLTPLSVSDPVLRERRAHEARYLAEVRGLSKRVAIVPWSTLSQPASDR